MVSPHLDSSLDQVTQAKVADLKYRGTKLVERLYGHRIRYHLECHQVQLDGEPIPAELFYLVLHRDHGLNFPKRLAKEIIVKVAQSNPFTTHSAVVTDPYLPREAFTPDLGISSGPEFPSGLNQWMLHLRSLMQRPLG